MQRSKFFSVTIFRTHSIGSARANLGYVAIFSNTEKFRCLYSHYGSCMPSFPKEYISPWLYQEYKYRRESIIIMPPVKTVGKV